MPEMEQNYFEFGELTVRTANALRRANMDTLEEVAKRFPDIGDVKGLGWRSFLEVQELLSESGYVLYKPLPELEITSKSIMS